MTREDIIRMAREAGFVLHAYPQENWLKLMGRFAALVAAAEREACAKYLDDCNEWDLAEVIRARGEVKP